MKLNPRTGLLCAALAAAAFGGRRRCIRPGQRAVLPGAVVPDGSVRAQRRAVRQRLRRLPEAHQRARRRHQRRQDHLGGMRVRLRDGPRRGVLRAPEGQGPDGRDGLPSALHGRHVRRDRQGVQRSHPDHHRRLRPRRFGGRLGVRLELPARRHVLGCFGHAGAARGQEGRRAGQAEGQEDRAGLPRLALRQGADRALAGARQDARLRAATAARHAPGRGAEGHLAADPPERARLRVPVGLGGDELDGHQGGRRDRLSAQQDVRRVVVRRRARCHAGWRRRQGLQRARVPCPGRPGRGAPGDHQARV